MYPLRITLIIGILISIGWTLQAQEVNCNTGTVVDTTTFTGSVFSNYGSVSNANNSRFSITGSVGEHFIGRHFGKSYQGAAGFYSRFLLPPSAPLVFATQGDLKDRIEISWEIDPLSPSSEGGFNIYRDGAFIDKVDKQVRKYVDFNVQAGIFYSYEVAGANPSGEGFKGSALGFLNPNGVVTGQVQTVSGNPVANAAITLEPTIGTSLACSRDDQSFIQPDPALNATEWTISFWMKQEGETTGNILSKKVPGVSKGWWLGRYDNKKSIGLGVGDGVNPYTWMYRSFEEDPDGWHHIALAFSGSSILFYIDGELMESRPGTYLPAEADPIQMGGFDGALDEVRIFNRQLSQTEINQFMHRTINSDAEGLVAYWKFDEGIGEKAFDISPNRLTAYLCGSEWSDDRPNVMNGAITDETGYYRIEGINYGEGNTFKAIPSKRSYLNYALEFNAAKGQYVELPDSILFGAEQSTIEVRLNNFERTNSFRSILANQSSDGSSLNFLLYVLEDALFLRAGDQILNLGPLGRGYQHLVFSFVNNEFIFYKNGVPVIERTLASSRLFDQIGKWYLGTLLADGNKYAAHFSGLIDEVAFYDTTLTFQDVQRHYNEGVQPQTVGIASWFSLNEGAGTEVEDIGLKRLGKGSIHGASWSNVTDVPEFFEHEFRPSERLLTLNTTNTSVDQLDFTDLSTIPVTGVVRFEGTQCYVDSVEILVNGFPASPPIYTDGEGKFIIDLEPGATVTLSPKFKNHTFSPAKWDIKGLSSPLAGLIFRDMTKREIRGQLAGGLCRASLLPEGFEAKLVVESLDGCFDREITLTHETGSDGKFRIRNLPAMPVSIALSDHDDPRVLDFFMLKGGERVDLSEKNDTTDFIYFAPPNVQIDTFSRLDCGTFDFIQIEQYSEQATNVRVFEDYYGQKCYLDTFLLRVNDNISDLAQFDTFIVDGRFKLEIFGGVPNIVEPFTKTLQVTANVDGRSASEVMEAVVTGERPRASTFATTTPEFPLLILRDPPGDNSYAYIEKGETFCQTWSYESVDDFGVGQESRLSLGPNVELGTGIGVWNSKAIDVVAEVNEKFITSRRQVSQKSEEVCITSTEIISTSSQDDIVGDQGGDVYMGAAMNLIFGVTDLLQFDTLNCEFVRDSSFIVHPDGFATTYIYSEYFIKNTLLKNLDQLNDSLSIATWNAILAQNKSSKESAVFDENISFDAGIKYEKSFQADSTTTSTFSFNNGFTSEVITTGGLFFADLGLSVGAVIQISKSNSESTDSIQRSTVKVGYVLEDDDPGDFFSVNILNDKKYGTPVFRTESGTSSCPWEPKTQPRDEVSLKVDKNRAINVPSNAAAVFTLDLGNISQSEETRGYVLQMANGSNPNGAIIKVNGQPLTQGIGYSVPFGIGQTVTLTVERGPIEYIYNGLEVQWYSDCEYSRAGRIGEAPDEKFYKSVILDVEFLEPCSPVDINSPRDGEVITPEDGDILPIRLVEYNKGDEDLEYISTQYRKAGATGNWINIEETLRANLGDVFQTINWDTKGIADGDYQIRAVTTCKSGLNPGISHVINITIERTPPELLGTPEPADGVLSRGDEISISFDENIDCGKIFQADIFRGNNIGLYNVRTGELVNAEISCLDNKIILVPTDPNRFLEGQILRVVVDTVPDLAGNLSPHYEWEFVVDRSPIIHEGRSVDVVMYEGRSVTRTRPITNIGGSTTEFTVRGFPDWVNIFPRSGSLEPGDKININYVFNSSTPQGTYQDTIVFENAEGNEEVVVRLRVLCGPPTVEFNPAAYSQSMTFQVQLDIEGELSEDEEDYVAAYIDGEARGLANVQYVSALDDYRAFLTVYGFEEDQGKPINLVIWDASACLLYGQIVEQFNFELDGIVGSTATPTILHTNSLIERSIPIQQGWNWLSFNLVFENPGLNTALETLRHPQGDLIKDQTNFAEFFDTQWVGSLTAVNNTSLFQFRADRKDELTMVGRLIHPDTLPIPISEGWNWIGYIPNQALPLNQALAGLNPADGDIIKSQTSFAQYLAGTGWIGSLNFLEAPKGYKLKISNAGSLTYPSGFSSGNNLRTLDHTNPLTDRTKGQSAQPYGTAGLNTNNYWTVTPSQFEYSMTMIGMLAREGENITTDMQEIGVFSGGELRGSAKALWVEPLQAHLFFLTAYANETDDELSFKLYDEAGESISILNEKISFLPDGHAGSVDSPLPFTFMSTGLEEASIFTQFDVFPNPFGSFATAVFGCEEGQEVRMVIHDLLGREVQSKMVQAISGKNILSLDFSGMSSGVYFISLNTAISTITRKVIKK